jgi:hypothetical protein
MVVTCTLPIQRANQAGTKVHTTVRDLCTKENGSATLSQATVTWSEKFPVSNLLLQQPAYPLMQKGIVVNP